MNEVLGYVQCPFCLERAKVKRNKSERLYFQCRLCGPVQAHGEPVQDWIEDRMEPVEPPEPEEGATTDPAPADEPAADRTPWYRRVQIDDQEL